MKKIGSIILSVALFCTLFHFPACAEEPATAVCDDIIDIVTLHYSTTEMAALTANGTVRTSGLEKSFCAAEIAAIEAWTDIVQLASTGTDFLGLRSDGSVVSTIQENRTFSMPEDPFDPNHWTNVKELVTSENEYFAVTNDGRVLVSNADPEYSFGGGGPYLEWSDIETLCFYAYPEARGLIGLSRDGKLVYPSDYCFFHEPLEGVAAIDSSGYIHCALLEDGTIRVAGATVEYAAEGLVESAAAIKDAEQIAVDDRAVLCRLHDGTVAVCHASESYADPAVKTWDNICDVQIAQRVAFGLDRLGRVHTAEMENRNDWQAELRSEVESWTDITRIKAYDGFGYEDPYVLGWRSDGSVVAAGLDLSGLKPR